MTIPMISTIPDLVGDNWLLLANQVSRVVLFKLGKRILITPERDNIIIS
jgi:hypothetical protein